MRLKCRGRESSLMTVIRIVIVISEFRVIKDVSVVFYRQILLMNTVRIQSVYFHVIFCPIKSKMCYFFSEKSNDFSWLRVLMDVEASKWSKQSKYNGNPCTVSRQISKYNILHTVLPLYNQYTGIWMQCSLISFAWTYRVLHIVLLCRFEYIFTSNYYNCV